MSGERLTRWASAPTGVRIAAVTAAISGVSVFVNSYGVRDFHSPALYTTAKNLVAAVALAVLAGVLRAIGSTSPSDAAARPRSAAATTTLWRMVGLAYVGVVGGGVAFVLFFDGLARSEAAPAAFMHDTLVIFVGLLAWPFLRERLSWLNIAAIGVLVGGEVEISRGVGDLVIGSGTSLVILATVLWAIETVIARRLLAEVQGTTLGLVRMGVGVVVLIGYLAVTGALGELRTLSAGQLGWALLTGLLLAGYVATWFAALARARAVDVTSVLVASAIVTAGLQFISGERLVASTLVGIALIAAGVVVVALRAQQGVPA